MKELFVMQLALASDALKALYVKISFNWLIGVYIGFDLGYLHCYALLAFVSFLGFKKANNGKETVRDMFIRVGYSIIASSFIFGIICIVKSLM